MRIMELKPSKRVPGRWLVGLEDGSILRVGEGEVIDFALCAGKELTEEQAERLIQSAKHSNLKERSIAQLTAKPMSRRELERKLDAWGADEEERERICTRLEELGLLNDVDYALRVVRHYSAKGFGVRKLRDELYRRGVPKELWEQALDSADDPAEAIDAFLRKRLPSGTADRAVLKKTVDALARRGYGWQDISEGIERLNIELEDNIP